MFQPTHRPTRIDEEFATSWGSCRVRGRLGQRHADVLESVLFYSQHRQFDGRLQLLVDPARVRRTISEDGYSGAGLESMMDDLTEALLVVRTATVQTTGHLIETWRKSLVTKPNPLGGERNLWVVILGDALCEMMKVDVIFHRSPGEIPRLKNGISKAIVRHCLSHKYQPNGGWNLDQLILAVCPGASAVDMRNRRRELRMEAAGIGRCGFVVSEDKLTRTSLQTA